MPGAADVGVMGPGAAAGTENNRLPMRSISISRCLSAEQTTASPFVFPSNRTTETALVFNLGRPICVFRADADYRPSRR